MSGTVPASARRAPPAVARLVGHALGLRFEDLTGSQARAAARFTLDTMGVGIAGAQAPYAQALRDAARGWGTGGRARLLAHPGQLPGPSAAFINAYQIHGQEFDCVHEAAVVHPMACILAAALAEVDACTNDHGASGITGAEFVATIAGAVDVAIALGLSARTGLRFFRPATAGAFGAAVAVSRLRGFDEMRTADVLGLVYSQLCGTMQAHVEASPVLPMQIGFNARNAIVAADLAQAGVAGPLDVLHGPFGYFELFEPGGAIDAQLEALAATRRVTELSHKPFPTGRATHGGLDGLLTLRREHGFTADDIAEAELHAPPLVHRLVARPLVDDPAPNYARLCMQYVGAVALIRGDVGLDDFTTQALRREDVHALGRRIRVVIDGNPDPNALSPQRIVVRLRDGRELAIDLPAVFGAPAKALSDAQHVAKFLECCRFGGIAPGAAQQMVDLAERLGTLPDVAPWLALARA